MFDIAKVVREHKLVLAGVLLVATVFACSYTFVSVKTRQCEVLCGEASKGKAKYQVWGSLGMRYPTKPHGGSCDCGA